MLLEPADERELVFRSADTLERLTGVRPVGLRTPSWDFSDATLSVASSGTLASSRSFRAPLFDRPIGDVVAVVP